jgi:hypothetical protein
VSLSKIYELEGLGVEHIDIFICSTDGKEIVLVRKVDAARLEKAVLVVGNLSDWLRLANIPKPIECVRMMDIYQSK